MVGKKLRVFSVALLAVAGTAVRWLRHGRTDKPKGPPPLAVVVSQPTPPRQNPSQTVKAKPDNSQPRVVTRSTKTPEQTHRDEIFSAFLKRRRMVATSHAADDNVSRLLAKLPSGEVKLDNKDLKSLTRSLLTALDVPVSSQLLVFTGSASQGLKVNPRNPRAIYFNDEVYVGVVPDGLLEVIGVDPRIGGVLYSFHDVGTGRVPSTKGGEDCTRCHSRPQSGYAMGFLVRSIVPKDDGLMVGNLSVGDEGHERPLGRRFGGWFVTSAREDVYGQAGLVAHTELPNLRQVIGYKTTRPGQLYDPKVHLAESSDILAHLLHEHQIGFHNRLSRALMSASDDGLQQGERLLQSHAQDITDLVSYMLFRNEAALPESGIVGDPKFIEDFSRNRHASRSGAALKDLDLRTRLLKHRCTYMVYTRPWAEMSPIVKGEIYDKLRAALMGDDVIGEHLTPMEKREIVQILKDTLPDLPQNWN